MTEDYSVKTEAVLLPIWALKNGDLANLNWKRK